MEARHPRIARRAFLLWNALAVAGAVINPLFGRLLRHPWRSAPGGREAKYYRRLGGER